MGYGAAPQILSGYHYGLLTVTRSASFEVAFFSTPKALHTKAQGSRAQRANPGLTR